MSRTPTPDRALAEAVASLREARGLSREALAFRSGVTPGTLNLIELSQLVPRWDTVRLIARGLDASLVDLGESVEHWEASLAHTEDGPVA